MIHSIGTALPPWSLAPKGLPRATGDDEDVVTLAVAAGRAALDATASDEVTAVVLVSRDFPLLEGGNSAPLLAGLDLSDHVEVREQLGGGPAALQAVADAAPGTLVIGADTGSAAGAAAVLCTGTGADVSMVGRVTRSMPVATRASTGATTDYADPRLLRELGVGASLAELDLGPLVAVAGVSPKDAQAIAGGAVPALPTTGASAPLFALAAVAERGESGTVLAIEQATVVAVELGAGDVAVQRDEPSALTPPATRVSSDADIAISLAAYARAFDAKLRLEAQRCPTCGTLAYPDRFRCLGCGSEAVKETVALPRDAEIYTLATIHVPVPGLATPYTVVLAELGDTGVRLLVRLTGAPPGSVAIGDRGRLVFRRVALRSGVPDYGYAFLPDTTDAADPGSKQPDVRKEVAV